MSRKLRPEPKVSVAKKKPPRWQREHNISRFIWIIVSLIIVITVVLVGYWSYDNYLGKWHKTVAMVNETTLDMDYYVKMLRFYSRNPNLTVDTVTYPSQVLTIMEDNELILQGAPVLDIEVTPDDIDNEIENYLLSSIGDSGNSSPDFIDVESLYEDWLERIRLSEVEYERLVEADLLRGNITDYLRITEVPEETEQVHLHIIFVDDEKSASLVSELLRDGGNFTDLAEEFSTIDELKEAKGDAGWVPRGIYPDLDDVIFSIEIGNVTEPIPATQGGYYIIKVSEKEDNLSVPDDYKDILAARAFEDWILDQRKASIIEEYLNMDDILWAIGQIT